MNYRTVRYCLGAVGAFGLLTGRASAENGTSPAAAEALYEQARSLMKQGDFEHACPKFKQSYDLDPGGGTLLNLAECYEKQGKFASAWTNFKDALVTAQRDGRPERVGYAQKHLDAIEPKVAHIVIEVPADANEPGLRVTLDGAPLGAAAWGVGMPVDPGSHRVTASAPGKASYEQTLDVVGGSSSLKIPALAAAANAPGPVDNDVLKKPVTDEPPPSNRSQRTAGFVIGGAGIVALGIGGYFGLHAMSEWNKRKDQCANGCTQGAKTAGDDAKSAALISDIGFGIGVIAAGVGGYLLLSAKSPEPESAPHEARVQVMPALGPGGGGLLLRGSY